MDVWPNVEVGITHVVVNHFSISVVLATKNRAESLTRFLCEMQKQRGAPPFEVVVANNASSDRTGEILAQPWAGLRVRSVLRTTPWKRASA